MSRNDSPSDRPRRLRVSLLTLMLLMTIAALAIGLVVVGRNNRRLEEANQSLAVENRRLRDEVGELSIDDPKKLYAIRIETDSYLDWRWRIWIPKGRTYRLRCVAGEVPAEGRPQERGGTIMLYDDGDQVIRYQIRRDPRDGKMYGSLSVPGASVSKDEHAWVEWGSWTSTTGGVGTSTCAYPPDKTIELCRHRVSQANSSSGIEDPSAGFLIWLEPLP